MAGFKPSPLTRRSSLCRKGALCRFGGYGAGTAAMIGDLPTIRLTALADTYTIGVLWMKTAMDCPACRKRC